MAVIVSVATVSAACKHRYDSCCTSSVQGICMTVIASAACMVCVPQLLYQQRAGICIALVATAAGRQLRQLVLVVPAACKAHVRRLWYQQRAKHVYDSCCTSSVQGMCAIVVCCTSRGCTIVCKAHVRQLFYQQRAGAYVRQRLQQQRADNYASLLSVTDAAILYFDAAEHAAFSAAL
jgi:hypothetical protein